MKSGQRPQEDARLSQLSAPRGTAKRRGPFEQFPMVQKNSALTSTGSECFHYLILNLDLFFSQKPRSCFLWWQSFSSQFLQERQALVFSEKRSGCLCTVISHLANKA
ncbi:MAG: hypothetical protein IJV98_02430, partial [Clostridia bacterium]|nr:hypothetical protein [Clostridia bacterium]